MKKFLTWFLSLFLCLSLTACTTSDRTIETQTAETPVVSSETELDEDGTYDSKEDVTAYLIAYGHLPDNYMTKEEARENGWEGGALSTVIEGMCIGGDVYGNYEGTLPEIDGRTYYECDINTLGKEKRGAERIIYSDPDLNIYYTADHYETFEHLYGDDA
jgi:guanyl-specific ribonuclease Sa